MKPILSASGKVRGYIRETPNLTQITTPNGRLLGYYNKTQNKTFTKSGAPVGQDNQIMSLLEDFSEKY